MSTKRFGDTGKQVDKFWRVAKKKPAKKKPRRKK